MIGEATRVGRDDVSERDLYVIELPTPDLENFEPPARHFACLLVMDASRVSDNAIRTLARGLLSFGRSVIFGLGSAVSTSP